MLIAYDSKTGNVKRFINKLNLPTLQIDDHLMVEEPFVLITYTTGFGQVPDRVMSFLERNYQHMLGVAASGNRNWGNKFARSADLISERYHVPVISKFEMAGTKRDAQYFESEVSRVASY